MKTAARGADLQGNITNHFVHKTSISRLMDAEVPVNYMAQPSSHKNLKSLDSYKAASIEHQRKMSKEILCFFTMQTYIFFRFIFYSNFLLNPYIFGRI